VGRLLTEGGVADALGMSRTPVREAFLRLEVEGLLALYPKRGAIVAAPGDAEARDLLQTRAMFETTAVKWIAERGAPADLRDTLRGHVERQAAAADALEFARADRALHEAVVAAGGNAIALALFEQTGPRLLRHWHQLAESAEERRRLLAEHGRLVEMVVAGDVEGYAALLGSHTELPARSRFAA
jgi:DNA-binding GntR family transcriptional regulator